ncbi:MAG: VWA domain-containing protein [Caldilineaceae bacterium]
MIHSPPRRRVVHLLRFLLLLSLIIPQAPLTALAAPSSAPPVAPSITVQPAPLTQAACPAGPSGLPNLVDRTNFCVRYNQANTTLAQATQVADLTEQYWARYVTDFGFRTPLFTNKLVVEIRNATCNGGTDVGVNWMFVNNGCFAPANAMAQATGHELFHRVQLAYGDNASAGFWLFEGTARTMEDLANAAIDNWPQSMTAAFSFNQQVNTYLNNSNVDITSFPQRYNSALWWKYFTEQYGSTATEPERGVDALRVLWETAETQDDIAAVNGALNTLGAGTNFNSAFRRFVVANLVKDLSNPPDGTYNYLDEEQMGNPAPYGPINPATSGGVGGTINVGTPVTWNNQPISRYGVRYYSATPGSNCPVITTAFNTDNGPAFYHVVAEKGNTLAKHVESSSSPWRQSFFNDGITRVVAVAGATGSNAQSDITLQCANPVIDIKLPNSGAVAKVGPFDGPGKFLAQVLVTNGDPKGPVVAGLTVNDFKARVNGQNALITAGGFVQEQYWLVIQAPNQGANGTYDLEIRLEESGTATTIATDTNTASVQYTPDQVDQVLVIDRSGSMAADSKLQAARDAANFYVDITRNNDGIAVVPFDHNVNPAAFPMKLVDLFVRTDAHTYINALNPGGATSIGDGMNEAVNQRNGSPTGNPQCSFVLLSDGMENSSLFWSDVQAAVQATTCPATTIAFGSAADETLMQNIATATGGAFFYNDVYVSALNAASADAPASASATTTADTALDLASTYEYANARNEGRQRLLNERGAVPPSATGGPVADQEHKVLIDGSVQEALFALKWDGGGCLDICPQLTLKLVAPDGKLYTEKDLPFTFKDTQSGHLGWRIAKPLAGQWKLLVNHADGHATQGAIPYRVIVSGESNLTVYPLLLPAVQKFTGQRVPLYALISGEKPIGNARVQAIVTAPDGTASTVPMYDDGQHDDGVAGDGLYAGLYQRVNQANPVAPMREEGGEKLPDPRDEGSYQVRILVNHAEFQREALGSFAVLEAPDTNQNRLPDTYEKENNLTSPDGDNDLDWLDNYSEYLLGTNPNDSDTDDGGENDGSEMEKQKDPFNPKDDRILPPDFVDATADVNSVRIHFDVKPGYVNLILYRAESANGPWQLLNQEVAPTGEYLDKEVKNGQSYQYKLMAVDAKSNRSAVVASQVAIPSADPFAPEAKILINAGAATTDSRKVKLSFVPYEDPQYYDDIAEMKLGNTPDLANAPWQPFQQEIDWELAETNPGDLVHVYALFRDKAGNESLLETAMIRFGAEQTACVDPNPQAGAVKLSEVPLDLVRTASQLLADMRGGPMAPGWDDAHFADLVRELYRPDVEGVAYYEFQVVNANGGPAGFIIVSTGPHDFPIAHWNYEGVTPTQHVACEAAKTGKQVVKFYKLDALTYAGEDGNGELAAMPGTQMVKVSGLDPALLDKPVELSSSEWTPDKETKDDSEAGDLSGKLTESGPTPPENLKIDGWESWSALKKGYGESYALFIEALKRDAAEDWETDRLAREFGEGLFKGNTYNISLLYPGRPEVQMSGEGAAYIDWTIIETDSVPSTLQIFVKDAVAGKELPFTAEIRYATAQAVNAASLQTTQESIKFAVLDNMGSLPGGGEAPNQIFLPIIQTGNASAAVDVSASAVQAINGSWSAWTYYWAGGHSDQRLYEQMEAHTSPNTSGCWSGCGGTAWAMLFGWADKQAASGNSYWAARWGLYRQNGGKGADAVAPSTMDSGVRNMTWEIRNDVGTWCAFGSGPTNPWDMDGASQYFSGRTGTSLSTHYNVLGIHEDRLREYARDSIRDRNTPAVIGTGWLTHYPLAYGYAWRKRTVRKCFIFCWDETEYSRFFYVNQGWGGSDNGWVSAGTWFAGEIRP